MPGLDELQARFAAALLDPEAGDGHAWVRDNVLAPQRRLRIYSNNSRIAHTDALAGIYPAVRQLVGEAFFEQLAERYRVEYPSVSGDLRDYGAGLPEFLGGCPPVAELAYLPDVARLEWAWHQCFHAAGAVPLAAADLAALATEPMDDTRLSLIPASRLVASPYPVADIWAFALDPARQQDGLRLDGLDVARLLIARSTDQVDVMAVEPAQFFWLGRLAAGETLTGAFEQTLAVDPGFDLPGALAVFVGLGVLTTGQKGGSGS